MEIHHWKTGQIDLLDTYHALFKLSKDEIDYYNMNIVMSHYWENKDRYGYDISEEGDIVKLHIYSEDRDKHKAHLKSLMRIFYSIENHGDYE